MMEKDVLIVDDETEVRELFARVLKGGGYSVDLAATVAEALALLSERRYGVVVPDWRFPDGDGAVIANLAAEVGSCAFVMSGYLANILSGNVDPRKTLMKPVRPHELLAIVRCSIGAVSFASASTNST